MNNRDNNKKVRFTALGGVEDINRNCYVVEYGKDIVIMDMGFSFPGDEIYGVNYVIPDVEYLEQRKERIRGIVLSHGHLDHVGAIPYVIEKLGFPPVYGREFTMLFLGEKLKEFGLDKKVARNIVKPSEDIRLGAITADLIPVTHAIPQSSAIRLRMPGGTVVYTGDYKFDDDPVREDKPDYELLRKIGREGIDLACMDSTNVYQEGATRSETEVATILDNLVKNARGRVIAATFSSLGTRLYSLVEIAKKYNRKIVITGRSMKSMIELLQKIGYVHLEGNLILPEKSIKSVPDEKLLILTTGTQGEEMAALSRMSRGEHRGIQIKDSDTVILSSSVIPGNQVPVQHLIDDLLRLGARVIHQSFMDVHTSGHGYQDDMKKMFELLQPKFVMPVHGWRSFIHEAAYLLGTWGMKQKNILHPETGLQFEYDRPQNMWRVGNKVACSNVYVDGATVGETTMDMIRDRGQMAENGVLAITIQTDSNGGLAGDPIIWSSGLLNESSQQKFLQDLKRGIADLLRAAVQNSKDHRVDSSIRDMVTKYAQRKAEQRLGKTPLTYSTY